jgi:two-component system, OmpR family, KDP operon response regulator KdpE
MHTHPAREPVAPPCILVVEDTPDVRAMVREALTEAGYRVLEAADGDAALDLAAAQPPDLVLLDVMLPGLDGFTVCGALRERTEAPIIVISARDAARDRVRALERGADDYLTKPVGVAELLARVRVALRRPALAAPGATTRLAVGDWELDLPGRRVYVGGRAVRLTRTEFELLAVLARQCGRVVTHAELLQRVWGPTYQAESDYLYVYVRRLREKLEADPDNPAYLLTQPGVGYALRPPG